jgi:hypothetical protein
MQHSAVTTAAAACPPELGKASSPYLNWAKPQVCIWHHCFFWRDVFTCQDAATPPGSIAPAGFIPFDTELSHHPIHASSRLMLVWVWRTAVCRLCHCFIHGEEHMFMMHLLGRQRPLHDVQLLLPAAKLLSCSQQMLLILSASNLINIFLLQGMSRP